MAQFDDVEMCNLLFLSTDSDRNLSRHPSRHFIFEKALDEDVLALGSALSFRHVWYLASRYGGCSCHYRHLADGSDSMDFGEPVEWFPEEQDDIESTQAVYDVIADTIKRGYRVDLADFWNEIQPEKLCERTVSLEEVSRDAFRFFEGWKFTFSK